MPGDEGQCAAISTATVAAARQIEQLDQAGSPVRERDLQLAFAGAIDNAETETRLHVPDWDPQPGHVDVVVRNDDGRVTGVIEAKLKAGNDIYECLWDFVKVLSLSQGQDAPSAYVIVGTTRKGWDRHATRELFSDGSHMLVEAIRTHLAWWDKYILGDSRGRPTVVPARMDTKVIARESLCLGGVDWELRTLRVLGSGELVRFVDGRPQ